MTSIDTVSAERLGLRHSLLSTIGGRVRQRRSRARLSRRVLSERCGVSERFLAQLEHGKGNISIVRLKSIADALQVPLDELVRDDTASRPVQFDDWRAHPGAIADLYRHADARDQERVVEVLVRSRRAIAV
ncbi:helix-turn-helix domain-containing protein [Acuticoccus sp.]|uniref:helix-turn-helix domain-containing protein n=1 Tax=Acuticoccus sp. TaxID=1904378 RepID=UPI003B52D45F